MAVKTSLARGLQESLGYLWQGDDDFSDCIVMVENTSFKCHRFILSACSRFFRRLLRSQMKESLGDVIHLCEMSKTTFDTILNSIYKGVDGLTEDNILDVWSASEFLQIDYLINECKNFAGQNISLNNCCRTLNHAVMYSAQNVIDDCLDLIVKNFEKVKNGNSFLQMTFNCFYQVIESECLVADCEDSVVDTVLKWVNYKPGSKRCQWLLCGTLKNKAASERQSPADISHYSLSLCGRQEYYRDGRKNTKDCSEKGNEKLEMGSESQEKGNKAQADLGNCEKGNLLEEKIEKESNTAMSISVDGKTICNKNDNGQVDFREDRKQHFSQLLSACRYCLVKPSCLGNLLCNHSQLLIDTGTYTPIVNALVYTNCVNRRHDSWPETAVYRTSSPNQHVMVFYSPDNRFMAYSLERGTTHKFATPPVDNLTLGTITVFDNVLYLQDWTGSRLTFFMLTKQKQWETISTVIPRARFRLLAHGQCIYGLSDRDLFIDEDVRLRRGAYMSAQTTIAPKVCTLDKSADSLVGFHKYIVLFSTQNTTTTAYYFNPENHKVLQSPSTLDGESWGMESFTHGEDVYILQNNGTLWKIFSTVTTPVNFEFVSKLWDSDYNLRGCVLYKKQLFIFVRGFVVPYLLVTSLPDICEDIKIIAITTMSRCLPMVLHEFWFMS